MKIDPVAPFELSEMLSCIAAGRVAKLARELFGAHPAYPRRLDQRSATINRGAGRTFLDVTIGTIAALGDWLCLA